nr:10007_t:CDS:2 [Entrophospora candida]
MCIDCVLKDDQPVNISANDYRYIVKLTMASLGSDMVSPGRTTLFIQYKNGSHIPLCHLTPGICEQQSLDTAFVDKVLGGKISREKSQLKDFVLENDQPLNVSLEYDYEVKLTMASLGSDMVSPGRTTLFIQHNNGRHIPLCHLTPGISFFIKCEQQSLDTTFHGSNCTVTFYKRGRNTVYLTGYSKYKP